MPDRLECSVCGSLNFYAHAVTYDGGFYRGWQLTCEHGHELAPTPGWEIEIRQTNG